MFTQDSSVSSTGERTIDTLRIFPFDSLEMASYFNSAGSDVTVVEMLDRIGGRIDRDIAALLGLSTESVSEHVGAIRQKIGAANRTEAVAIAMRKYLLKF